jgi:hypothetical protein
VLALVTWLYNGWDTDQAVSLKVGDRGRCGVRDIAVVAIAADAVAAGVVYEPDDAITDA